jgi:hypothetical protein
MMLKNFQRTRYTHSGIPPKERHIATGAKKTLAFTQGDVCTPNRRKELPTADVAAAGGWSDVATLLRCYQQPDEATMLSVMSHPRKILDRVSGRN